VPVAKYLLSRALDPADAKHFLLKAFEVSERVGVRVVLVHAKEDGVRGFYEKYGFIQSPLDSLTLLLLLPPSPTGTTTNP
jgi:hypothetical protein